MSSGNIWPDKKKLKSMKMNTSELTSRNQKPIMPIVHSSRYPSRNDITSASRKAAIVPPSGQPGK